MDDIQEQEKKSKHNSTPVLLHPNGMIVKYSRADMAELKRKGIQEGYHAFDSAMEAEYYRDMIRPELGKSILAVVMQPKFTLLKSFRKGDVKHLAITYSPDFQVFYTDGTNRCIDVKGHENDRFPLKRKLFDALDPDMLPLLVLKKSKKYGERGWIPADDYKKIKSGERKAAKASGIQPKPRARTRAKRFN